jgi:hypothetical protein
MTEQIINEKENKPEETKNDDLNNQIFSQFLGLYMMKMPIPENIFDYVKTHECPSKSIDAKMAFTQILGSSDLSDPILYQMIIKTFSNNKIEKEEERIPHMYLVEAIWHCAVNALTEPTNEEIKDGCLDLIIRLSDDLMEEMEESK